MRAREMTEIALLTGLITLSGAFKIPSLFPGTEFQLSAPIAVAICVVFGLKKYIIAGVLSSLIGLMLGTQNVFNVAVACVFRLVVGAVLSLGGRNFWTIAIAGPIGTTIARLSLSLIIGKAATALLIAAVPGMVFTAIFAMPLVKLLERVYPSKEKRTVHVI